ncbi:MAG: 16S rRNA (guanine(966)-N(2))-methyltransferase RsmD [Nitrospirota bacterium]|nr:16S rRNA (guanine(966)-N(2))-methyltransferase RsmD [Nitrospirota bacterium]
MRISGGSAKGRSLAKPKGDHVRPTSAKVREAVFNIIRPHLEGAKFLDLCAGTGAMGMEALSQGVAHAAFVDSDSRSARLIKDNLARLELETSARIVTVGALDFVKNFRGEPFDIVYFDPPYAMEELEQIIMLIGEKGVLKSGGALLVEHASKRPLADEMGRLGLKKSYRYGDTSLSYYIRIEEGETDA